MNTNFVVLEGNLTRDPEIREAGSSQVSNFGIAVNKRVRKDGEWTNGEPQFYDISAWGFDAERSMALKSGDAVIIIGELNFQVWEQEGKKRSAVKVTARAIGKQLPRVDGGSAKKSKSDDDEIPF
jgi:single-strand DNA-binding protein